MSNLNGNDKKEKNKELHVLKFFPNEEMSLFHEPKCFSNKTLTFCQRMLHSTDYFCRYCMYIHISSPCRFHAVLESSEYSQSQFVHYNVILLFKCLSSYCIGWCLLHYLPFPTEGSIYMLMVYRCRSRMGGHAIMYCMLNP